jgi:hypothetical protein
MIEALIGSIIAVIATGALASLIEINYEAISPASKELSNYERRILQASSLVSPTPDQENELAKWLDDKRNWRK